MTGPTLLTGRESRKPWTVYRRDTPKTGRHKFENFDDGSLGFVPHIKTAEANGVVPYLCVRQIDCERAVEFLNARYPRPTVAWLRDHWESVVKELSENCVAW